MSLATMSLATMRSSFCYQVGGCLAWDHPTYVERQADFDLLDAIYRGAFCSVLAPAQTGKSSLGAQVCQGLIEEGYRCLRFSAQMLTTDHQKLWDQKLASVIWQALSPCPSAESQSVESQSGARVAAGLGDWLSATENLLPPQRIEQFTRDFLLPEITASPLVIFIDDVEALCTIPFLANDLFEWIGHCYSLRKIYPMNHHREHTKSTEPSGR